MKPIHNWWARLVAALVAALGVLGIVIASTPSISQQPAWVSDDALLTAETAFAPEQIQDLLAARTSPLASYTETVGEQTLSAAELFWAAAQNSDYGLNPKALLATLYIEDGLNWTQPGGLYAHLKQMALELSRAYQAGLAPVSADESKGLVLPRDTAATYALARYYAPTAKVNGQLRASLQDWSATYRQLFDRDPAQDAAPKSPATQIPFIRLPFDEPKDGFYPIEAFFDHAFPGQIEEPNMLRLDGKALPGAHYSGCWSAMTCYSGHNATDYTLPTGTPVYAVAAGVVTYRLDAEGGVIIDHGNGYRSLYWHLDKIVVNWQQPVKDGELIGYSGSRGIATHPHLHFGLRLTALSRDVDPSGWWSSNADPWPAPSRFLWRGGLLADNSTAQMHLFYNQYWVRDPKGYGGESWYTATTNTYGNSTNWAIWGTTIPKAGPYTVSVYWPKNAEATTAAVYQVWHAGGMALVKVNQRIDGDRFVPLGSFNFIEGPIVVILTDLTPDAPKNQRVYFDAIRWDAGNLDSTHPNIYLPVIQGDSK